MAKGKVNSKLSLSVMLTGKFCIDLFFYSVLCIDSCQANTRRLYRHKSIHLTFSILVQDMQNC